MEGNYFLINKSTHTTATNKPNHQQQHKKNNHHYYHNYAMGESLIKWVNSFEGLSYKCNSLKDLTDGVLLFEIGAEAAPKYFDLSTLKTDVSDNWVLKSNNIKKIVHSLENFYQIELEIEQGTNIDPVVVAKGEDDEEIIRLIEAILGVVVECENKAHYIQNIMSLEEETQMELMTIIQNIFSRHQLHQSMSNSPNKQIKSPSFSIKDTVYNEEEENEALFGPGRYLTAKNNGGYKDERVSIYLDQIDVLTKDRDSFRKKYENMKEEHKNTITQNENLASEKDSLISMIRNLETALAQQTESKNNQKKSTHDDDFSNFSSTFNHINRQEDEKSQLLAKLEEKDRIISDLKRKNDELKVQATEARKLRDEIDLLREKVASSERNEEKAKKFQKKVEEIAELRSQIKTLQESNERYIKQTLDMEENSSKVPVLKAQVDSYKQQIITLKSDVARVDAEHKSALNEANTLKKKVESLSSENRTLQERAKSLQDRIDEVEMEHNDSIIERQNSMGVDPAIKEKLMRLERENKKLREEMGSNSTEKENDLIISLNAQLEVANNTIEKLRNENPTQSALETSGTEFVALKSEYDALKARLSDLDGKEQALSEVNEKLKLALEKITVLTTDKGRLEGYVRTAKAMIRDLREKGNQLTLDEQEKIKKRYEEVVSTLQTQLLEKDKEIQLHKRRYEEGNESSQREQKLLITAFYEMGLEIQRLKAPPISNVNVSGTPIIGNTPRSVLGVMRKNL
eukprot:TRINITY_DN9086_c0_g2_i1.p1 TRINITY_DN9086_c0_g2~~TRINITY_DN9086_c0_g2_i1.p1  ORF type:complete len:744 (-),score=212.05 TRINITY_DN9086_c0_g2_i1:96-2327(-)